MKNLLLSSVLTLSLLSCKEPIELNFPAEDAKLVIDGFITNVEKEHLIELSYSAGFDANGVSIQSPVEDAQVEIIDLAGNTVKLVHHDAGDYYTPVFKAEDGQSYKIIVRLENETFESSFQKLPDHKLAPPNIRYETIDRQELSTQGVIVDKIGVSIMTTVKKSPESIYYQWLQRNYHIWNAPSAQGTPASTHPNKYCFVRNFDRIQIDIYHDQANNAQGDIDLELDFIPPHSNLIYDAAIEVVQLVTNEESHTYWSAIKATSESVGSLFDPAPATIQGNITNQDGTAVLGFFGVYTESISRLFYYNCELPLRYRSRPPNCFPHSDILEVQRTSHCYDCTLATGIWSQVEAPEWWRPIIPEFGSEERRCNLPRGGG